MARLSRSLLSVIEGYCEGPAEGFHDEKHFALQDAVCGAICNVLEFSSPENKNSVADTACNYGGRDILAKFVTFATTNKMAGEKAGKALGELGIKGVSARSTWIDRMKRFVIMFFTYKMIQGWYWDYYPEGDGTFDLIMSLGRRTADGGDE